MLQCNLNANLIKQKHKKYIIFTIIISFTMDFIIILQWIFIFFFRFLFKYNPDSQLVCFYKFNTRKSLSSKWTKKFCHSFMGEVWKHVCVLNLLFWSIMLTYIEEVYRTHAYKMVTFKTISILQMVYAKLQWLLRLYKDQFTSKMVQFRWCPYFTIPALITAHLYKYR